MPKPHDIPNCPGAPAVRSSARQTHEYQIKLVTPMFGGGVKPGAADATFPIRGTSIRGQLRFWWRATRGRRLADPMALWLREEEIFGSTRFPSPVHVNVALDPKTRLEFADKIDRAKYALFALKPGDRLLCEGLKFSVAVMWLSVQQLARQRSALNVQLGRAKQPLLPAEVEDITDDLRDAVWAWVNIGGLGGRTRRGCGSLWCEELAPKSVAEIDQWFQSAQQRFGSPSDSAAQWPRLGKRLFYRPDAEPPVSAWLNLITLFREFRQGKIGRNQPRQGSRPGRSYFPEPETIRETIRNGGQRGGTHPPLKDVPRDAFPRAEFGLPIVFQFQHNEVEQTVLYPRVGKEQPERMASPLILKPLCLADGSAVLAIIPLDVPWFTEVDLTLGGRDSVRGRFPLSAVRRPSLATYPNSPLVHSATGSAIEAFLAFARSEGFQEVTR